MTQSAMMRARIAKIEQEILKRVCKAIDSPRSLAVYQLIQAGDYRQYLTLETNPYDYDDTEAFADDYLVTEMLKKSCAQELDINRELAAFEKWEAAENLNALTNDRLEAYLGGDDNLVTPLVRVVIDKTIDRIHRALGPLTNRTLNYAFEHMDFGPGSTASVKGDITRGRKYLNDSLTTTQQLLDFGLFCLPRVWRDRVSSFEVIPHNTLTFVPKNAKVDRPITIENDLNIFVQKGIGKLLSLKLKSFFGVDTSSQWQENRQMARIAFKRGLCTVDLSSASDTISLMLVRLMLPDDWFDLLNWARPEYTYYKRMDKTFRLEKFSGMGCGYTFELETMIFHSLSMSVCEVLGLDTSHVTTFGDDMILPVEAFDLLSMTLSFLGLSVNKRKTFGKGVFHESCGEDYFLGFNVRPFYLRSDRFDQELSLTLYTYCNLLRRYANHRNGGLSCDDRFLPAWLYCFSRLSQRDRLFVPDFGYESAGLVGNLDEAAPSWQTRDGINGWRFKYATRRPVETQRYREGAYIGALASSSSTSWTHGREPIRGRTKPVVTKTGFSHNWVYLGPWC